MSGTETQGLASLEIMACDCPLFVVDTTTFTVQTKQMEGASSVTCWSEEMCGMKSSMDNMPEDFPRFLEKVYGGQYTPRAFVEAQYSWRAAAGALRRAFSIVSGSSETNLSETSSGPE